MGTRKQRGTDKDKGGGKSPGKGKGVTSKGRAGTRKQSVTKKLKRGAGGHLQSGRPLPD